ncbi:MAG TPA: serine/threonine-protein kinase [Anaeromyxobacter sp.]|nr:serine/threonine-protein kinase [Anaeromyxobacter sp.]
MRKPIPYGRFLLLERIAIGGMAEVYAAIRRDDPAGRLLAVKRILPTLAEDAEFITMFLDEARLVVQLDHPGIVAIHELGKLGEGYYIAMDYVAGRDLRALLDRLRGAGERLPVPLAALIAARVADALDHAHRKRDARGDELRIVHRDVSPANVLLAFDGSQRIIDFGIAQAALRTRRQDTVLRGKFGYMSPEMVRGLPVDRRSDVFALGAVLHEMLTGQKVFRGRSELAVLERVRSAEVAPPSAQRPGLPAGLDEVVLRALAREPEARFPWASELAEALRPFAWGADPPALARLMATTFPGELRAELDRIERARAQPAPAAAASREPTQVFPLTPGEPPAPDPAPASPRVTPPPAPPSVEPTLPRSPPPRRTGAVGRAGVAAGVAAAAGAIAAALVLGASRHDPPDHPPLAFAPPAPVQAAALPAGAGRLLVQVRTAATLYVDGAAHPPALYVGEVRTVTLPQGEHRVELRTEDGRRAAATVQIRAGESAELLGVDVQ